MDGSGDGLARPRPSLRPHKAAATPDLPYGVHRHLPWIQGPVDKFGEVETVHTVNWAFWGARIRGCESGGSAVGRPDYRAENPQSGASGAYQFLDDTWAGRFGVTKAAEATPEQQERAAFDLFRRRGTQPWTDSQDCWDAPPPPVANAQADARPLLPGASAPPPKRRIEQLTSQGPATTTTSVPSADRSPPGPPTTDKIPPPVDGDIVDKLLPPRR